MILLWQVSVAGLIASGLPDAKTTRRFYVAIAALLVIMGGIGIWDVANSRGDLGIVWLGEEDGALVRASALLFNPNLFGYWCAFVAAIAAYGYHSRVIASRAAIGMLLVCGFCMLLSASRGGLLTGSFILACAGLLMLLGKERVSFAVGIAPLAFFWTGIGGGIAAIKTADMMTRGQDPALHAMTFLGDRFLQLPLLLWMLMCQSVEGNGPDDHRLGLAIDGLGRLADGGIGQQLAIHIRANGHAFRSCRQRLPIHAL